MNEETKENQITPKKISFVAQIFSAVWVAGWSSYLFLSNPSNYTIADVVFSGVFVVLSFSPVYLSIIVDKFAKNFTFFHNK